MIEPEMKIIIVDGGEEFASFTLTDSIRTRLVAGRCMEMEFEYDPIFDNVPVFKIREKGNGTA